MNETRSEYQTQRPRVLKTGQCADCGCKIEKVLAINVRLSARCDVCGPKHHNRKIEKPGKRGIKRKAPNK